MGQNRTHWHAVFTLISGTCLVLAACQTSPGMVTMATSSSPAPKRTTAPSSASATPDRRGRPIVTSIGLRDGEVYGVGMPVTVDFSTPIPDPAKADVQRRLSVISDPGQAGAWRWYGDQEVIYRPKAFWRPDTRLTVKAAFGGLPVDGQPIDTDRSVSARIGRKMTFQTSDTSKQMRVLLNDKLVRTFPVSLGAPETPSSSGHMVVMTREADALWVYSADDQLNVKYAERLTGDGEYIHAAPWSVTDQGHDDVSHGCTNLSTENAAWVYENSKVGDPVTVSGTAKHLTPGNGWTVWDMSWNDYVKGGALPQRDRAAAGK